MTADQPLIQTQDLAREYLVGSEVVRALRGVSVTIQPGEFVAVMGPSGSGKSTFMNLLGCLDTPTAGKYLLEGREVSSLSPAERARVRNRRIGFVFQSFNLLPRTSARENIVLPLRYAGVPAKERLARAARLLELVGLAERGGHHPSQLSGGQQQRVAIGRAMANDPALILADEPTGALDTRTGIEIMALFQDLNQRGITVVVVTHEPEIAGFAQRLLKFRDGAMVSDRPMDNPRRAREILGQLPPPGEDEA
ncbi:MAG: ABC transporter ATP-binding protein [Deltaproteobacteria bacterium]|nr:ABC transporter ATP-binding protein [Deltaproteobacteria bacterium]